MAVLGPTASGKSRIAHQLALDLDAEIISADSMQVYRGMDIGTAKPSRLERDELAYHLIDVVDPEEPFTVAEYQKHGRAVLESPDQRPVIIVGGSGLHFRSLVDDLQFPPHDPKLRAAIESMTSEERTAELVRLDPDAPHHIDLRNERRVIRALEIAKLTGEGPSSRPTNGMKSYKARFQFSAVGLDPGDDLAMRINTRLDEMLTAGLVREVDGLSDRLGRTASQAVGYSQLLPVVRGEQSLEEGIAATRRATVRLARQQRTFFRRDPRIVWLPWVEGETARLEAVRHALAGVEML